MTDDLTYKSLLAGILANPACDTSRLVLADYLDEQGEHARAEFIRVQIESAQIEAAGTADPKRYVVPDADWYETPPDFERLMELRKREKELWDGGLWKAFPLPWPDRYGSGRPHLSDMTRGFVALVACHADMWLKHADAILAEQPVQRVKLTTMPLVAYQHNSDGDATVYIGTESWTRRITVDAKSSPYDATRAILNYIYPHIQFALPTISGTGAIITIGGQPPIPIQEWSVPLTWHEYPLPDPPA